MASASGRYQPPSFIPRVPFPEYFLRVARLDLDRKAGYILFDPSPNPDIILQDLTWRRLLSDIASRAKELTAAVGRGPRALGDKEVVISFLARTGYSYYLTMIAMIMLRWTPLVISPRNSPEAVLHLMHSAKASYLAADPTYAALADSVQDETFKVVLTSDEYPSELSEEWEMLFTSAAGASQQELEAEASQTVLYLHTSGSTGHPKVVPWTHTFVLADCKAAHRHRTDSIGIKFYTFMPFFHSMGIILSSITLFGLGGEYVFVETRQPPSLSMVIRHLSMFNLENTETLLPPSILEDLVNSSTRDEDLEVFRRLHVIMFGGAPLRNDIGNYLVQQGVRLLAAFGMSETGPLSTFYLNPARDPEDWQYYEWSDDFGIQFKAMDDSGLMEMLVLPGENIPCTINHTDPVGFATGDMWIQHPDPAKSHLWKHMGRRDDITVLSNGEKTDNKQLENLLRASPLIQHAAIFGAGRFLNGAILSPATPLQPHTPETVSAFLDSVWPHIAQQVNPIVPQHSRLVRSLVLVEDPAKPFLVTDKNTVKVKLTLALYQDEIEAAYRDLEEGGFEETEVPPSGLDAKDAEGITTYVCAVVANVLKHPVSDDVDLFEEGLDSLLAIRVRSALITLLKRSGQHIDVPRNIVYSYPTVKGLMEYLQTSLTSQANGLASSQIDIDALMEKTVEECTRDLARRRCAPEEYMYAVTDIDDLARRQSAPEKYVYAVTGTTGSLGSFFVSYLLEKPGVRKIYLLNRRKPSISLAERHKAVFEERQLDYGLLEKVVQEGRAVHLEVDLAEPHLGLSEAQYDELRAELTHIVHIAWLLNFNLILPSFKPHLAGVHNLIALALTSHRAAAPHFTFLSSVAAIAHWPGPGPAPEGPVPALEMCLAQGYAHSKYAAERIVERAGARGLRAAVVRTGQLAGAEGSGAWARSEFMPILMRASTALGVVPGALPDVRWLPVNVAAQILYAQIQHACASSTPLAFYNLETSRPTPWQRVAHVLAARAKPPLAVVPAETWLDRVRASSSSPAKPLLKFFEALLAGRGAMPPLDVSRTRAAAGALVDYVVDDALIGAYVDYACRG